MRRGDVVLVVLAGDYGKPRPAIVLQDDALNSKSAVTSVIVCPLTSHETISDGIRIPIHPDERKGLTTRSEAMVDKITSVRVALVRATVGEVDQRTMRAIEQALLLVLGFAREVSSTSP